MHVDWESKCEKGRKKKKKTVHTLFRILSFLTGHLLEYVLLSYFAAVNDR